ncbi:MAG: hypothetical protein Q4C09_08380 [Atopobiaceae bacterium]|nr:hypothetical protein [Atopobiaceae bacterium]
MRWQCVRKGTDGTDSLARSAACASTRETVSGESGVGTPPCTL